MNLIPFFIQYFIKCFQFIVLNKENILICQLNYGLSLTIDIGEYY